MPSYDYEKIPKQATEGQHPLSYPSNYADLIKYQCSVCAKPFASKAALKMHSYIHTGEQPFVCEICGASFNHLSNKKRHIKQIHRQAI